MAFVPAKDLPKSHRPRVTVDSYICGVCGTTANGDEVRNINRVEGFQHRKQGVICDHCVKRIVERREANAEKMRIARGETFL